MNEKNRHDLPYSRITAFLFRTTITMLVLGSALLVVETGWSAVGIGLNFAHTLDAFSAGGGAAVSNSWRERDSAVGQPISGVSSSRSFVNREGFVQAWPHKNAVLPGWSLY